MLLIRLYLFIKIIRLSMEAELEDIFSCASQPYIQIPEDCLENIYNLFIKGIKFEPTQAVECYYMAYYFRDYHHAYVKYFLMAIEQGHVESMHKLASYYYGGDLIDDMKKYYLMAISKGYVPSMLDLAEYYFEDEHNYEEMEKYYMMAVDAGSGSAMGILTGYYFSYSMYFELMKLQINYLHITVDRNAIITSINLVFKNKLYVGKEKEFVELLNKFEVFIGDKLFTGNGVLLSHIINSMIKIE